MTELAKEYGTALFDLCSEEKIAADVLSELRDLRLLFEQNPDFCRLLGNMSINKDERCGILDSTLRGKIQPYLLNFLKLLCERGAIGEFSGCEEAYRDAFNKANGIVEATVFTAEALTSSQRSELLQKLVTMNAGRAVNLTEKIDEKLMGGVMVEMNGQRWDNTILRRLSDLRRRMAGEN